MTVTIRVTRTGAYQVTGDDWELVDHDGNPIPFDRSKPRISLCRCGASTTKPFCDGTHSRIGFLAAEAAVKEESRGATEPGA